MEKYRGLARAIKDNIAASCPHQKGVMCKDALCISARVAICALALDIAHLYRNEEGFDIKTFLVWCECMEWTFDKKKGD